MKFLSVNRIEKNYIVCEDENSKTHVIPVKNLPQDVREGSVVLSNGRGEIKLDKRKTRIRKNIILNLRRKIYGENK
jgi:hypothetical protein